MDEELRSTEPPPFGALATAPKVSITVLVKVQRSSGGRSFDTSRATVELMEARAAALSEGALSSGHEAPPLHPPMVSLRVSQVTASKHGDATNSISAPTQLIPDLRVILACPIERAGRDCPKDAAAHGTAPAQTIKIGKLPTIVVAATHTHRPRCPSQASPLGGSVGYMTSTPLRQSELTNGGVRPH